MKLHARGCLHVLPRAPQGRCQASGPAARGRCPGQVPGKCNCRGRRGGGEPGRKSARFGRGRKGARLDVHGPRIGAALRSIPGLARSRRFRPGSPPPRLSGSGGGGGTSTQGRRPRCQASGPAALDSVGARQVDGAGWAALDRCQASGPAALDRCLDRCQASGQGVGGPGARQVDRAGCQASGQGSGKRGPVDAETARKCMLRRHLTPGRQCPGTLTLAHGRPILGSPEFSNPQPGTRAPGASVSHRSLGRGERCAGGTGASGA